MYGLEDQKKEKSSEFIFELEKKLHDQNYFLEVKGKIEGRLYAFKDLLHAGCEKEHFDKIGRILYGYAAFLRVISRFAPKS